MLTPTGLVFLPNSFWGLMTGARRAALRSNSDWSMKWRKRGLQCSSCRSPTATLSPCQPTRTCENSLSQPDSSKLNVKIFILIIRMSFWWTCSTRACSEFYRWITYLLDVKLYLYVFPDTFMYIIWDFYSILFCRIYFLFICMDIITWHYSLSL